MDNADPCAEARSLLAELAVGALGGPERAMAVRHVGSCPACSRELAELTTVADGLLLLAPAADPSPGFESAVIGRLGSAVSGPAKRRPAPGRGRRRVLALAAGFVAAALAGGTVGAAVTRDRAADDRALADRYRQILSEADGQYLRAVRLTTGSGADVGTVFLYQGQPSWALVSVSSAPADGAYDMVLTDRAGTSYGIGVCRVAGGTGTTGYQLPAHVADIAAVALNGPGGVRLSARTN
jgi:hypothetical protein